MIFKVKPEDFKPKFEVVGCFVECDEEIVLLHRQDHKPQGGTWGIPSGKRDDGENLVDTACRETAEETGIVIPREEIQFFLTVYVRFPEYDFTYHMFHAEVDEKVVIKISDAEHKDARWILPKDALHMPLIQDLDACIELFLNVKSDGVYEK